MADDDKKDPPAKDGKDDLGDPGKRALDAERDARKVAEKEAKDLKARIAELEDKDKGDVERLKGQVATLTQERDDLAAKVPRLEVALEKGLTAAQARRLVGDTKADLETDADDIIATFKPASDSGDEGGDKGGDRPSNSRPIPDLKGGGKPEDKTPVETNPAKLAESVPRL